MFVTTGSRATRKRSGTVGAPLVLNFGTITANPAQPTPGMALTIVGTWNNAGVTFDAPLFMNVTNTASGSSSLLADFQLSGAAVFSISANPANNQGLAWLQIGKNSDFNHQAISFASATQIIGIYCDNGQSLVMNINNTLSACSAWTGSGFALNGAIGALSFAPSTVEHASTFDTHLYRDAAAGVLAIGNGSTNSGSFRVYNTTDSNGTAYRTSSFSAPTNYERGIFDWTTVANVLSIGTDKGGTGSARSVQIRVGGNEVVQFGTNGWIDLNGFNGMNGISVDADTSISRVTGGVWGLGNNQSTNNTGWLNWGGEARVTSNFTSSNTTLTAITGISSVVLQTARNYSFEAWLAVTGSSVGGVLVGVTATSTTITSLSVDGFLLDSNTIRGGQGVITSTGTAVVSISSATVTSSNPSIRINGMIRVASSGTFGLTLAQSTANNAPQTIVSSGSWMIVQDMP